MKPHDEVGEWWNMHTDEKYSDAMLDNTAGRKNNISTIRY